LNKAAFIIVQYVVGNIVKIDDKMTNETSYGGKGYGVLPPQTAQAVLAAQNVSVIYLSIYCLLFLVDTWAAVRNRKKLWLICRRNIGNDHPLLTIQRMFLMRFLLFVQCIFNIVTFVMVALITWNVPFFSDVASCTRILRVAVYFYFTSVQLVCFILIVRCGFVEGLTTTNLYKWVSYLTKINLAVFVPILAFSTIPFFVDGFITDAGVCVMINTAPLYFAYIFLIGIGLMTIVMMYLFVAPIRRSIEQVHPSNVARLKETLYRNLFLNSLAMICQISCSCLFWTLTGTDRTGWEDGASTTLSLIFPCTDIFFLGICARLMMVEITCEKKRSPSGEQNVVSQIHLSAFVNVAPEDAERPTLDTPSSVQAINSYTNPA
jgi:hypothetical protein